MHAVANIQIWETFVPTFCIRTLSGKSLVPLLCYQAQRTSVTVTCDMIMVGLAESSAKPGSSVQLWTVLDRVTEPTERVLSGQLCTVQYDTCTELYSVVWYLYKAVQCGMVLAQSCTESYSISTTKDSQNLDRGSQNFSSQLSCQKCKN
jgi:hypothetical protein